MDYKCKNCGGELHFDPKIAKLKCDFCGNEYELSEYESPPAHPDEHDHDHEQEHQSSDSQAGQKEDLASFTCQHCGAQVVADKDTVATSCVFCGTPMVLDAQMKGAFRPSRVIPFEVDKKQIEDLYESYIRTKPFYPPEYSKAKVIEKIKAVYLPFWLYDMTFEGGLKATGEHVSSFRQGDWIVTTHKVFDIAREGQMRFIKVPTIASSKTPRNAMDALEPFRYEKLAPYNNGYLPGFVAQRYDRDEHQCQSKAANRAKQSFDSALKGTILGYSNVRIYNNQADLAAVDPEYVLLPAYLLFMDYDHDEDKLIAINGQTGKIVGNVPVDAHKRNRFFISRFFLLWICLFVLALVVMIVME